MYTVFNHNFFKNSKKVKHFGKHFIESTFHQKKKIPQQTQQELSAGIHNLETKQ